MLFDTYTPQMVDVHAKAIAKLIQQGHTAERIAKELNVREFKELFSIAKARLVSKKTSKDYYMTEDDLRFATNELVAAARAKRLSCTTLIDIGCGVGIQSIAFAKTCKRVIAVDIDARKIRYALENAKKLGVNNIEFIHGDGLKVLETIKKADAIFVDPERAPSEDVRDITKSFHPSIPTLLKIGGKVTPNIAVELPPQIQDIPFDCEREYTSVDHDLNRLTVYFGKLKKAERSACVLPGNHVLHDGTKPNSMLNSAALNYLYEVDPAVVKASLTWKLTNEHTLLYSDERDVLLTSNSLHTGPYYKARYELIEAVPNKFDAILAVLLWENAGNVVLRAKISPMEYWAERRVYESKLKGDKTFHVFLFPHEALVCRKL
jgi:predicted O-methyltransferase YrrM